MDSISIQFIKKLYNMAHTEFSEQILNKARECFTDYISCVIGGCRTYGEINENYIKGSKAEGVCHIFGIDETADLHTAVMINAFNAHVLELDDSHRSAMTHLGAPIFSALIGVAELYDSTLEQLLKAAVVGYEGAIRLANAVQPSHKKRGFHVSGTCCTVGCAIGVATMLDYTEEEMQNVLSASATSAAGLLAVISGKSEQKPYNIANAAVAGVNAALYGKYFIGAVDILGDSRGFFHAMADTVWEERLFEDGFAIEGIYQKLYAACRHCHAPMEAMLKIRNGFETDVVKGIEVRVYDLAINGHVHTEITGVSSAKQSIPYGVAAACVYGDCGLNAFTVEKVLNENLLNLVRRVNVTEDKELTALVPGKRTAIVEVTLDDGKKITQRVDYAKGEPENPITENEWLNKFYGLVQSAEVSKDEAANLYRFIQEGDKLPINQIFRSQAVHR